MAHQAFTPFTLPCGQTIKNRIAKAAMEENMADSGQIPGDALFRLYDRWANGGTGLLITGNVMVSHRALTGPGGIVLEKDTDLSPFQPGLHTQNKTTHKYGCKLTTRAVRCMLPWVVTCYHRRILRSI